MPRLLVLFLTIFLNAEPGSALLLPARQAAAPPQGSAATRGEWVARRVDDRETGKDARLAFRMKLYDRQGRVRERALTVVSKKAASGDKSLTRFTYPADIAGTGFLVWEHAGAETERFLFLPSLGRVRRIAGSEAQESFVGSDFTYEDIGGRDFDDYTYTLLDDAADNGAAYRLESKARDASARFPRIVSTVRKDTFVVTHAEIFDKRGDLRKVFDATRVEKTGKYWTVMAMTMTDLSQKTKTELGVAQAEYDLGLSDELFTRRELEKIIR